VGCEVDNVVVGVLAIAIGGLLTVAGYAALRLVIALWGAFAGFMLGAGLVASFTGEGFLATVLGWVVGLALGSLFGLFAYLYYAISVVIGMAAIGFAIGTTLMAALGITWTWVLIVAGVAGGLLLAILAIVGDLPMLLLTILGAVAGASVTITGVLVLFGRLDRSELGETATTGALELGWGWTVAYLGLVVFGLVVQLRDQAARTGTLRESWSS
jgi:hypothetical protein